MIKYNILDPKGNITILVETAVKVSSQSFVAAKLMELEPEAEQVGFVKVCGKNGKPEGKLRMAGGEFCGNATMCTAALKCIKEKFNNKPDILPKRVAVSASGHRGVVYVDVTAGSDGDSYLTRGEMPWPKGFGETVINGIVYPIVHMGGIDHVIIGDEFDDEESKKLIKEACEIENTDAIGFMFIKRSGNKVNSGINGDNGNSGESGNSGDNGNIGDRIILKPLVYIKTADTLYYERSCASGSSALGAYLAFTADSGKVDINIENPGGTVRVEADSKEKTISIHTEVKYLKTARVEIDL